MKSDQTIISGVGKTCGAIARFAERRLRRKLRRTTPSEPWIDAQFRDVMQRGASGDEVHRVHDPRVFPPGGAKTAMKRCPQCGVMTPPMAFEGGVCLDHAEHGNWGRSPSAVAIAALQHLNLRLDNLPLAGESVEQLRAEIARFKKRERQREAAGSKNKGNKKPAAGKGGGGTSPGMPPVLHQQ